MQRSYRVFSRRSDCDSFPLPSVPLLGYKEPLPGRPELEDIPPLPRSLGQFSKKPTSCGGSYQAKVKSCRLPGKRPQRTPMLKLPYNLGEYPVPDELREAVEGGEEMEIVLTIPCLEEVLSIDNAYYCKHSH